MAENLFEQPKPNPKGDKAITAGKIDFTGSDPSENTAPLSLLSISGIDSSRAIAAMKQSTSNDLVISSPVMVPKAENNKRQDLLAAVTVSDPIKTIYEDGILKLYDDAGKTHVGFKFLEPGGAARERQNFGAARKEKLEDWLAFSIQLRKKF